MIFHNVAVVFTTAVLICLPLTLLCYLLRDDHRHVAVGAFMVAGAGVFTSGLVAFLMFILLVSMLPIAAVSVFWH